jgi:hypothetical protein
VVDRGGLENRCGPLDHRGFESHPLRKKRQPAFFWLLVVKITPPNITLQLFSTPGMNHARFFVIGGAYDTAKTDG